jgi:hypothetical protein
MKWQLIVPLLLSTVFLVTIAENPVSHKYVVIEGGKTFIGLSDKRE